MVVRGSGSFLSGNAWKCRISICAFDGAHGQLIWQVHPPCHPCCYDLQEKRHWMAAQGNVQVSWPSRITNKLESNLMLSFRSPPLPLSRSLAADSRASRASHPSGVRLKHAAQSGAMARASGERTLEKGYSSLPWSAQRLAIRGNQNSVWHFQLARYDIFELYPHLCDSLPGHCKPVWRGVPRTAEKRYLARRVQLTPSLWKRLHDASLSCHSQQAKGRNVASTVEHENKSCFVTRPRPPSQSVSNQHKLECTLQHHLPSKETCH